MRAWLKDTITFNKCIKKDVTSGVVESIENKGTPDMYYIVKTRDGELNRVYPKDIMSSMIELRNKKLLKPKAKKSKKE
jgi:hypothetical protein